MCAYLKRYRFGILWYQIRSDCRYPGGIWYRGVHRFWNRSGEGKNPKNGFRNSCRSCSGHIRRIDAIRHTQPDRRSEYLRSQFRRIPIWLAVIGATLTAFLVYGLASIGYSGATPLKLALAGAAAGTALQSLVNTVMMPNTQVMDQFRFWQTGSIGGATWNDIFTMLPFLATGFIMSVILAPSLNAMALGDEMASGLGINVFVVRLTATLAGVLLCSATTALAGPIGFVGLMIPHLIRSLSGADLRWLFPMSALAGSALLIIADVSGRVLGRPGELEVGIVTALLGAPVFIYIVRKVKVSVL